MDLELAGEVTLVTGASRGAGWVNDAALIVDGG